MVARTPPKHKAMVAPLNPTLLRETVKKVDRCMARLQELQYTVAGGTKVISGVSLSPRSTKGYLRTSLRCKQESLRIKNLTPRKTPSGEWRKMSLPAMLLGETVGEIIQASQFAREIVSAVASKTNKNRSFNDPKTPLLHRKNHRQNPENTELRARRKREKQSTLQSFRSESTSPSLQRARSRITFKVSPQKNLEHGKENSSTYLANRVSPRNRPWARKTVLFPNPLFLSSPSSNHQKFCKTKSPVISKISQIPHRFLIKSPPVKTKNAPASFSPTRTTTLSKKSPHKFLIKSPPVKIKNVRPSLSPTRMTTLSKKSPHKFLIKSPPVKIKNVRPSLSPTRMATLNKESPRVSTASKLRRSFSPSRLANKLISPLKSRKSMQRSDGSMMMMMSGLKKRQVSTPMRISDWRM